MSMNTRTKRLFTAYCHEYSIIHEVPWSAARVDSDGFVFGLAKVAETWL